MNQSQSNNSTNSDEAQMSQLLLRSDRWMGTLAHELRNPLGTIMMSLEVLNPFCASDHAARVTREMAMDAVQHMSRLIEDAMDLSRVRRNSLDAGTEPVDLVRTVSDSIRNCHRLLAQKNHDVALELPVGKVYVRAHPTRLQQIVSNLLTNSANYTNHGGRIWITIETADNLVKLKVRDNGVGLAPGSMTNIFEPYWKGTASDGLGIGLALVKSLVELHGGSIAVYSEGIGKGAEFVVRLPAIDCAASSTPFIASRPVHHQRLTEQSNAES